MDREYMLHALVRRLKALEFRYRRACQNEDEFGNTISNACAKKIRTDCNRDIALCRLIQNLLLKLDEVVIEDYVIIDGFHRLVEPVERHRDRRR